MVFWSWSIWDWISEAVPKSTKSNISIDDIEFILNNIRQNSVLLSNYHKKRHYELKEKIKYFKRIYILFEGQLYSSSRIKWAIRWNDIKSKRIILWK